VVVSPESHVRVERLVALVLALSPGAWAGGANLSEAPSPEPPSAAIARQLDDETVAVDRALAAVNDKLAAGKITRIKRLRAAVRLLHAAPGDGAMAVARRVAAMHLIVARDAVEHALLAEEAAQLRTARERIAGEIAQLSSIAVPDRIAAPAPGEIARHFGTLVHERSKATLSRRGIDIEVDDGSPVTAPAAGTVRYAGPIRGLDQGVILDHGAYLTVIGKLGEVAVPVGTTLATGDRIGHAARHRIYFEVRVKLGPGGLPIDPAPLFGKG
jgi:septal ring factor EnvC (AmiA/AmiB activator)